MKYFGVHLYNEIKRAISRQPEFKSELVMLTSELSPVRSLEFTTMNLSHLERKIKSTKVKLKTETTAISHTPVTNDI
jgi:recombinational DNA repair protein RecR